MWNNTVSIINNPLTPEDIKSYGGMLLRQYNTAGGKRVIEPSLKAFCAEHSQYAKTLWIIRNGDELRLQPLFTSGRYVFDKYPTDTKAIKAFNKKYNVERYITLQPNEIIFKDFIE